ncbi:PAAR motif protein [compost metagenome]
MGKVSLVGVDSAGGKIVGPGAPNWTWDGQPISLLGDKVEPHAPGPHMAAVIETASPWMTIDGVPVTRVGSTASCGHGVTGTSDMDIP